MRTFLLSLSALVAASSLMAADSSSFKFGDTFGVPPLSLLDSTKEGRTTKLLQFGSDPSSFSGGPMSLLAGKGPTLADVRAAAGTRKPRLAPDSRMPILEPNPAIDYKMIVRAPDPSTDFKLIIQEPAPTK
jgi:hypothetical protein